MRIGARGLRRSWPSRPSSSSLQRARIGQPPGLLPELALATQRLGQVADDQGEAAKLAAGSAPGRDASTRHRTASHPCAPATPARSTLPCGVAAASSRGGCVGPARRPAVAAPRRAGRATSSAPYPVSRSAPVFQVRIRPAGSSRMRPKSSTPFDQESIGSIVIGRRPFGSPFQFPVALHESPRQARCRRPMAPPAMSFRPPPASTTSRRDETAAIPGR